MAEPNVTTTNVPASRTAVLDVLADFAAYPEWSGGVKSTEVLSTGADGRAEKVRFSVDAGPIADTYVVGYAWTDDTVRFSLVEPGKVVTALDGAYRLAGTGTGTGTGTEVAYELTTELKMPMMGMFRNKMTKMIAQNTLKDLRKRLERG